MKDGYYALIIAIVKSVSLERAFALYYNDKDELMRLDLIDMAKLKRQGLTYSQIGQRFNVSRDYVFYWLKEKGYLNGTQKTVGSSRKRDKVQDIKVPGIAS